MAATTGCLAKLAAAGSSGTGIADGLAGWAVDGSADDCDATPGASNPKNRQDKDAAKTRVAKLGEAYFLAALIGLLRLSAWRPAPR
jgi:hypothetical protein